MQPYQRVICVIAALLVLIGCGEPNRSGASSSSAQAEARSAVPSPTVATEDRHAEGARRRREAQVEASARAVAAAAKSAEAAKLRAKVHASSVRDAPHADCQGKGYPPYQVTYSGGTFDENEVVAFADGCVHEWGPGGKGSVMWNDYCCPTGSR